MKYELEMRPAFNNTTNKTITVYRFLPESCRWLIQKGKIEEASKTIEKAARVNGVTLSEKVKKLEDLEMDSKGLKIWHMFSHPTLVARALIVFLNWFVNWP